MCARNVQHQRATLANRMRVTQRLLFGQFQDDPPACCPHGQYKGPLLGTLQGHIPVGEYLLFVGNTMSHEHPGRNHGNRFHQNPALTVTPRTSMDLWSLRFEFQ